MSSLSLQQAYQHCQQIVHNHYENFPVASWFLARNIRQPISVIYAFARHADDLADEGNLTDNKRLEALEQYQQNFEEAVTTKQSNNPVLYALADVIQKHQLPVSLFLDLLTAFKMDTRIKRYNTFKDVMHYCHYSANPVGRLLLHLHKQTSEKNLVNSDAICSALQLINFYQDIEQDYTENNRIYLPLDEMQQFHVSETDIANKTSSRALRELMLYQVQRAKQLILSGSELGQQLKGLFGLEIRLITQGGLCIANKLENISNVFERPRLTKTDKFAMLWHALLKTGNK